MGVVPTSKGRVVASFMQRGTGVPLGLAAARGFTLIEVLVTMAIAAIITAFALPGYFLMVRNDRLSAEASSLVLSLNYARNQAVKADSPVWVCALNPTSFTTPNNICNNNNNSIGADWKLGWSVVPAPNQTPNYPPLQSVPAMTGCNYVTTSTNMASSRVFFSGDGRLIGDVTTAGTPVFFYFCDVRGATSARAVKVDILGRIELFAKAGYQSATTAIAVGNCPTPCT